MSCDAIRRMVLHTFLLMYAEHFGVLLYLILFVNHALLIAKSILFIYLYKITGKMYYT